MQNTSLHVYIQPRTHISHSQTSESDVIFSSTQLSPDFKVSHGGPLNNKISVKINRCLFKISSDLLKHLIKKFSDKKF